MESFFALLICYLRWDPQNFVTYEMDFGNQNWPSLYFKKQVSPLIFGIKIALKAHGVWVRQKDENFQSAYTKPLDRIVFC